MPLCDTCQKIDIQNMLVEAVEISVEWDLTEKAMDSPDCEE
jgi:hypothetical protein